MNGYDWKCCQNKTVLCFTAVFTKLLFNTTNLYSLLLFLYAMFKNLAFLKLLAELLQGISASFQPITANNHVFVGHVFQHVHARDWLNCIRACHDEPRCISYNYDKSAGENGLCELSDCGLDDLCNKDKSLVYSMGFVFQQIREEKVSFIDNDFSSSLMHLPVRSLSSLTCSLRFSQSQWRLRKWQKLQRTHQMIRYRDF